MVSIAIRGFFITALTLALAPSLIATPAQAQYDRHYGGSSGDSSDRYEARQDEGGLLGSLFGRNERARREAGPQREPSAQYAQMSATDLTVRLDRLENQLRQLTGIMEQLQFRNQQLEQQIRRNQEDVEFRLQEMGGKPAPRRAQQPAVQPAHPAAPGAIPPARRSDVFDPNDSPNAPGAPHTLGSIPTRAGAPPAVIIDDEPQIVGPAGGRQAGAPLDLGTLAERVASDPQVAPSEAPPPRVASVPSVEPRNIPGPLPPPPPRQPNSTGGRPQVAAAPTATPRDEFALAQGYVQRRDYALAEEGLREFLKKYPTDRLIPEAHYWLGESLYQRQRYRDAAESFLTVSTKYERSGKAPDALMRLGQSLAALGEREAACATLGEVVRKYPRASPGVKQNVQREQKRVRC